MTNLMERINSFHQWLRANALDGFTEQLKEHTDEHGIGLNFLLLELANDMKLAVRENDAALYAEREGAYMTFFNLVNKEMATTRYKDLLDHILDTKKDIDNLTAQTLTVESLWRDARYRTYLDVRVELVNHQTGEYVYLVADRSKAPAGDAYVTIDELDHIHKSGINPWDYVNNRRNHENTHTATGPITLCA